jgi:cytochrome c oxidase subunit III
VSLALHYEDIEKQNHAARLGMWVFVASEMMFFAALFGLYAALRAGHPAEFREAARHSALALGTANTALLLTSSLLAVLAVDAARHGRNGRVRLLILGTAALGVVFLGVKGVEYARHFHEGIWPGAGASSRGEQMFFDLYYAMTGLHALHVIAGVGVLAWLARRAPALRPDDHGHMALELGALYWHFVDIVWLFLWPLFYLLR